MLLRNTLATILLPTLLAIATISFVGCEKKEKIIDIETPDGGIEIERSEDSGDIKIEVKED